LTFRYGSIDYDAAALEPSGNDAEYDDLFAQLRLNGLEPIGRRTTTCWFFLHHWRKTFLSRVFASSRGDCIALVYQLRAWDQWRLCFATAFSDGAIVETANQMESFRIDEPNFLRWGLATTDRGLLLERHREACRDFAVAGSRKVASLPAEEINGLIRYHEARNHRKRHRWTGIKSVSTSLWFLGIGVLLVRQFAGSASYVLPVCIIAWGFLWPAIHASLFRASARSFQAEDLRRRRNQPAARQLDSGGV
jgi:hypothetical protein